MNQEEQQEVKQQKRQLTKAEKKVVIIMAVAAVIAVAIFAAVMYINDYYKATEKAQEAIRGNELVKVIETEDYYLFSKDGGLLSILDMGKDKGIIFYPGGKVDEVAYAPLLLELAEKGYDVYLVKMPAKLAILGKDKADAIIAGDASIKEWTMMGHSLGGAMAATYTAENDDKIDNLVLLAAYSLDDLTQADVDVYSFYGSEDKVLNMEKYQECLSNLPSDKVENMIEGGNHAYFGNYGEQDGDGTATITRDEQQETVLDIFLTEEVKETVTNGLGDLFK